MTGAFKIAIITKANKLNASSLARAVGVIPQRIIDITNERTLTISHDLARRINRAFPQYSVDMLTSDDERLWLETANNTAKTNQSYAQHQNSNEIDETIIKYEKLLSEKDKIILERDDTIAEKDKIIAEKNKIITDKEKIITLLEIKREKNGK